MVQPGRSEGSEGSEKREAFLAGGKPRSGGVAREMFGFLRASGKWWLAPVIVGLMLIGLAIVLGGTAAGPFIYAAF
jgi:hypothetical protein